jgi:aspartyl-tRNA synthetase
VEASQDTDRPFPRLGQDLRLNHRWVDLRVPSNNAIMRIQSAVCQLFREALYKEGFVEIHSPKIIAGESEGGKKRKEPRAEQTHNNTNTNDDDDD